MKVNMVSIQLEPIQTGIVLDHIQAGKAMQIYTTLRLDELECTVAILKNVESRKMGRKDLIKIDQVIDVASLDALGFIDPNITLSIIDGGKLIEKRKLQPPPQLTNVIRCKNPRCITSIEQDIDQVFNLTRGSPPLYRCSYCEAAYANGK